MRIAFFGSSLVSAYWNGAATYYRGIVKALATCGYDVTFYEPDAYGRQANRDIADPEWATVVIYRADDNGVRAALQDASTADILIKASGVGVYDSYLEKQVLETGKKGSLAVFWDVDAPATLERVHGDTADPFRALIPGYDLVLTYGGGAPVVNSYKALGARHCVPVYNALDPATHHPAPPDERFVGTLSLLANRLPDREQRIDQFFFDAARRLPDREFLIGGSGWESKAMPPNVRYVGHVYTGDHNTFNCSALAVLNVSRDSMAQYGFSPATRVFEAAGAGACLITDSWSGIEEFFEPNKEILIAKSGADVATIIHGLVPERAQAVGDAARRRALADHTYAQRIELVDELFRSMMEEGRC